MAENHEERWQELLAAARVIRTWDEARLEDELRREAERRNCDLEITQTDERHNIWKVAFTQVDQVLDLGPVTLFSAEADGRHHAMENLLLMLRFEL